MPKHSGFTLIELLVVISIISILSAIALVIYTNVIKTTRDNKRLSDLKFIQSALEQYNADQKYYPYSQSVISGGSITNTTGAPAGTTTKTYLTTVPSDPTGATAYQYRSYKDLIGTECLSTDAGNCVTYCLYAKLEGTIPALSELGTCPAPTLPRNYGVSKP